MSVHERPEAEHISQSTNATIMSSLWKDTTCLQQGHAPL